MDHVIIKEARHVIAEVNEAGLAGSDAPSPEELLPDGAQADLVRAVLADVVVMAWEQHPKIVARAKAVQARVGAA